MSDLQSLIERVEKATGPDREIDARLCATLRDFSESEHYKLVVTRPPSSFSDWMVDCVLAPSGKVRSIAPPAYTASIDAALSLVSRVLPEAHWRLEKLTPAALSVFREDARAQCAHWATCGAPGEQEHAYAPTPALAICLALLKAVQAQAKNDATEETRG